MTVPKRIQMSRQHPWRAENPDAVIVSRGTDYGNPFRIGGWYVIFEGRPWPTNFPGRHSDARPVPNAEMAVELYRRHLEQEPRFVDTVRRVLAGHDLACWCNLSSACHADVLLEIANGERA